LDPVTLNPSNLDTKCCCHRRNVGICIIRELGRERQRTPRPAGSGSLRYFDPVGGHGDRLLRLIGAWAPLLVVARHHAAAGSVDMQ
jgi:hypothetical protein